MQRHVLPSTPVLYAVHGAGGTRMSVGGSETYTRTLAGAVHADLEARIACSTAGGVAVPQWVV